jgi:hypothetical protein
MHVAQIATDMVDMVEVIKIEQEDGTAVAGAQEERGAEKHGSHEEQITSGKVKKARRKQSVSDQQCKRACLDCTKRCARVHGRAASSSSDKAPPPTPPSFFKVMMGHFSEKMVRNCRFSPLTTAHTLTSSEPDRCLYILQWCRDPSVKLTM